MKYNYWTIIVIIILALGCKGDKTTTNPTTSATQATKKPIKDLPSKTLDELIEIFEAVTYVDYIFYDLPFSLSQDNVASVQANVAMISIQPPFNYHSGCKALGREFFHVDGEIKWEAELYFNPKDGCMAYVFYEGERPTFANAVSDSGIKFYTNLLNQKIPTPGE